jgi:DNA-binding MarR family transcriptional regulator
VSGQTDRGIREAAAELSKQIEAIRTVIRASAWEAARALEVPLTPPQLHALELLVDEARRSGGGLALSELSKRMGLAHSTVSGIVDRLQRRELVQRSPRPDDRRYMTVELTAPVKQWLAEDLPLLRLGALEAALADATEQERSAVLDGVATLHRLLAGAPEPARQTGHQAPDGPQQER